VGSGLLILIIVFIFGKVQKPWQRRCGHRPPEVY